jgi:hypothetical protein
MREPLARDRLINDENRRRALQGRRPGKKGGHRKSGKAEKRKSGKAERRKGGKLGKWESGKRRPANGGKSENLSWIVVFQFPNFPISQFSDQFPNFPPYPIRP